MGRRRGEQQYPISRVSLFDVFAIGEINIGQRCREIFGDDNVFNLGFLTGNGTGQHAAQLVFYSVIQMWLQ